MTRISWKRCSALLLITGMSLAAQAADLIQWAPDFETAQQTAQAENKLLLIHFWSYNCAPCSSVDEHVFPRPSVAQTLHENFVPVKVNVDEHPELRLKFQVDRRPTDVVVTPEGQIVHEMVTPQDPREYVHRLSAIALANSPRTRADSPRTQNESRWGSGPQADSRFVGGTRPPALRSDLDSPSNFGNQGAPFSEYGPGKLPQNGFLPDQVARDSRFASRYERSTLPARSMLPARSTPPTEYRTEPAPTANSHSPHEPRAVTNQYVEHQPVPRQQADPGAGLQAAPGIHNPYSGPPRPHGPASIEPSVQVPTHLHAAPAQLALGLDGRCSVTLVRDRVWQKGDRRWGVVHRGRTYLFVGPDQQKAFLADPDKYSPILAGMDVVRLAQEGRVVEGNRRYGVVYDDDGRGPQPSRIYLFDSADSRDLFEQGPNRFLQPVLQAMQQGRLDALLR